MTAEHIWLGVGTVLGSAGLYFLLAGEVSGGEAVACAITLAVVGPYAVALGRTGTVPLRLGGRGMVAVLRGAGGVVPDLWRVGRALAGAIGRRPAGMQGVIKRVPFRFGAFEAADVGRRAAVGVALSLAPNGFVLGMDDERDEILLHQLGEAAVGGDREWPA